MIVNSKVLIQEYYMKKITRFVRIVLLFVLMGTLLTGCKKNKAEEVSKASEETVSEKTETESAEAEHKEAEAETEENEENSLVQEETDSMNDKYEAFISGDELLYTDLRDFKARDEEGNEFSYYGDYNGMTISDFFRQIDAAEAYGLEEAKLNNVSYSIIDCGMDGVSELAIKAEYDQYGSVVTRLYVVKNINNRLELCYQDYYFERTQIELSANGKICKFASSGADTNTCEYEYINADGDVLYDYGVTTSYSGLRILDDRFDSDLVYGDDSDRPVFLKAYCFLEPSADNYDERMESRLYTGMRDDEEPSNGINFEKNTVYLEKIFDDARVELHSLNEIKYKINKHESDLGLSDELKKDMTIKWTAADMSVIRPFGSDIVNNNGHFVKVGDKIYYHVVDADFMYKSALFGEYADVEAGRTIMFEYDPSTKNNEIKYYDYASGPIAAEGGYLYNTNYTVDINGDMNDIQSDICGRPVETGDDTCKISDKKNKLLGSSTDASFIATYIYSYENMNEEKNIAIYQNGKQITNTEVPDYLYSVKVGKDEVYYIGSNDNGMFYLVQFNAFTGDCINLGELPSSDGWAGVIDECIIEDGNIYFAYSFYEGTGNFFKEGFFVKAQTGKKDSLTYTDMPENKDEYGEPRSAAFAVIDGNMVKSDGEPLTCDVTEEGILGYYDENGEWLPIVAGYGYKSLPDEGYRAIELAELVGDSIYFIYNENERTPEDDIGWRYAYRRNKTYIYRVNIDTCEVEELLCQGSPKGE